MGTAQLFYMRSVCWLHLWEMVKIKLSAVLARACTRLRLFLKFVTCWLHGWGVWHGHCSDTAYVGVSSHMFSMPLRHAGVGKRQNVVGNGCPLVHMPLSHANWRFWLIATRPAFKSPTWLGGVSSLKTAVVNMAGIFTLSGSGSRLLDKSLPASSDTRISYMVH